MNATADNQTHAQNHRRTHRQIPPGPLASRLEQEAAIAAIVAERRNWTKDGVRAEPAWE